MCQWILQQNGQLVSRRTALWLKPKELSPTNISEANKCVAFDAEIKRRLGEYVAPVTLKQTDIQNPTTNVEEVNDNFEFQDDNLAMVNVVPEAGAINSTGHPMNQQSMSDLLINAEVLFPPCDTHQMAMVIHWSIDLNRKVIG